MLYIVIGVMRSLIWAVFYSISQTLFLIAGNSLFLKQQVISFT